MPRGKSRASDFATVAYSNSGAALWTNRYDGPAGLGDYATAIAVDRSGNVFVTGPSVTIRDFSNDPPDYATIKYSNWGAPLWTNYYRGPANLSDASSAIAVDNAGNVFVTGTSQNSINQDYATIAYSNTSAPLWTHRYSAPTNGDDWASAVAVDKAGNVFVTGFSRNGANTDYATIKYSSSVPPPPRLVFQKLNNGLVLSWTNAGFNLQAAAVVTGPFINIPASTSIYTNAFATPRQFFRLKLN